MNAELPDRSRRKQDRAALDPDGPADPDLRTEDDPLGPDEHAGRGPEVVVARHADP